MLFLWFSDIRTAVSLLYFLTLHQRPSASHCSHQITRTSYSLLSCSLTVPTRDSGHVLLSWFLQLLQVIYSHLQTWREEPHMKESIQHLPSSFLVLPIKHLLYNNCSTLLSVTVTNTETKSSMRRIAFIWFILPCPTPSARNIRAASQAQKEVGAMKENCLLACFLWFLLT